MTAICMAPRMRAITSGATRANSTAVVARASPPSAARELRRGKPGLGPGSRFRQSEPHFGRPRGAASYCTSCGARRRWPSGSCCSSRRPPCRARGRRSSRRCRRSPAAASWSRSWPRKEPSVGRADNAAAVLPLMADRLAAREHRRGGDAGREDVGVRTDCAGKKLTKMNCHGLVLLELYEALEPVFGLQIEL